ncbi:MAG: decarboxylating 6-phosphogluconate dehydrogenase [Vallitaleaceae bacterium]|nr:decarboxylating 6-phosphogluconate dehydrogenase [Vallitaleaceae bacterium]
MQIGLIGLGRMGYNLALNMRDHGHEVVAYNRSAAKVDEAVKDGMIGAYSLEELVSKLEGRKVIWLMVPNGQPTQDMINQLLPLMSKHDILIDGGNSNFNDTLKRYEEIKALGIDFVDAGTSGGIEGARNGACSMVGAEDEVFAYIEPLFRDICTTDGYLHCGRVGSGHYVKMVHNGIEYGMMQAIGEGFEIYQKSQFDLDYYKIAKVFNHGSVIRGWLMELTESAFSKSPELADIKDVIGSNGEGLWTVEEALKIKVPVPVIASSLFVRNRSEQEESFSGKVVAALRNEFGGHAVEKK